MKTFIRLITLALCLPLLAATCSDAKPVVQKAFDVARSLCVLLTSDQKPGVSAQEIAETFCKTEAQVRPYLDVVLKAQKDGVGRPEPAPVTTEADAAVTVYTTDGAAE